MQQIFGSIHWWHNVCWVQLPSQRTIIWWQRKKGKLLSCLKNTYYWMWRQKRCQVLLHPNRTHAWTTASMWNAKCFVEIEMANVGSNKSWACQAHLPKPKYIKLDLICWKIPRTLGIELEYFSRRRTTEEKWKLINYHSFQNLTAHWKL